MCDGCGKPRDETFDPAAEEAYDVDVLVCHACSARERKADTMRRNQEDGSARLFGEYFVVRRDVTDG